MSFTLVYDAPVIHRIHKTTCPVNASSPQVPPVLPVFLRHSSPLTPKKPINTKVYRFFQQPLFSCLTPRVGLEPTTPRLTAVCSTIELSRNTYTLKDSGLSLSHPSCQTFRSSLRPISSSQLHALLHFHPCPINLVVFKGSYRFCGGYLILGGASRLDAFSVYPFPTWLPGHAFGKTTGTPEVSPPRSSRTKGSSSQISYARAG